MGGGKAPAAAVASAIGSASTATSRSGCSAPSRFGSAAAWSRSGHGCQAALIADLALHAPDVVSRDRLVDDLWAGDVPATAVKALQVHVSQLRKALGPGASALVTRAPGYALEIDAERIDARRFERLLDEGPAARVPGALARTAVRRARGRGVRARRGAAAGGAACRCDRGADRGGPRARRHRPQRRARGAGPRGARCASACASS